MKKSFQKLVFLFFIVISITSCGIKEAEVKPDNKKIRGELGDYIEIVDDTYKITKSKEFGKQWEIMFKLKNIIPASNEMIAAFNERTREIEFKVILMDENGKPISGIDEFNLDNDIWSSNSQFSKLINLLKSPKGTEEWFTLNSNGEFGSEYEKNLPKGISNFSIRTNIRINESIDNSSNNANSDNSNNSETSNISTDVDFDSMISSYEDYIDSYITLLKKAKNNDLSALSEYPAMLQKAQNLQSKIENVKSEFSSSQLERFIKLQEKIAKTALEM